MGSVEYQPYEQQTDSANGLEPTLAYAKKHADGKRGPWRMVFRIAIAVLVVSLVSLGVIAFSYYQGQLKYHRLEENLKFEEGQSGSPQGGLEALTVDWDALLAINPDTVAWVYVPGTNINYPVVRGTDNDYYLTHDFDGDQGWLANFGAVFLDYRNAPNWQDNAYFIYGHHMNDGSMFADVANMADQGKFDASRTVYLLSPMGNFKLRTFALIHCSPDDPLVQITFNSSEEMAQYVQDKMNRSIVDAGDIPKADEIGKVFAMATCDNYSAGRYVLYSYVEQTTADGLLGEANGADIDGVPADFVNDLS